MGPSQALGWLVPKKVIIIEENSKIACGEVMAKALLHLIKDEPELSNKLVQSKERQSMKSKINIVQQQAKEDLEPCCSIY